MLRSSQLKHDNSYFGIGLLAIELLAGGFHPTTLDFHRMYHLSIKVESWIMEYPEPVEFVSDGNDSVIPTNHEDRYS